MLMGLFAFCMLVLIFHLEKRAGKKHKSPGKDVWGKDTDAQYFMFEDFHNHF